MFMTVRPRGLATGDDRSRRQLVEVLDPLANGAARHARVRADRLGLGERGRLGGSGAGGAHGDRPTRARFRCCAWTGTAAAAVAEVGGAHLAREHAGASARDDALARMEAALNALPVRQRRVVYLTFYRGVDDQGNGTALGISPVTARPLRRRALQNLRAGVGQWHHSEHRLEA